MPPRMRAAAIIRPQNSTRFVAIAQTIMGEPAMSHALVAVIARPAHIHPYTALRNAVTRSARGTDGGKRGPESVAPFDDGATFQMLPDGPS